MTREDLVEAGVRAIVRQRPLTNAEAMDAILDAVEPMIRAEYEGDREAWEETMRRYMNGVLDDLHAQVEALRDYKRIEGDGVDALIWRSDVLALLDGRSE